VSNNGKNPNNLRPIQRLAIQYLANGKSNSETARLLNVTRQTIGNWMGNDLFVNELTKAEKNKITQLVKMYQDAEVSSFKTLKEIMEDENAKDADRIKAAKEINHGSYRLRERIEVEERLANDPKNIEHVIIVREDNLPPKE